MFIYVYLVVALIYVIIAIYEYDLDRNIQELLSRNTFESNSLH